MDAPGTGLPRPDQLPGVYFQHSSLPGPDYIRVITILPANSLNSPLECDIEVRHLDESAEYEALSYSWGMNADGDDTLNRTLSINGQTHLITQNLFEGLLRLRADAWPSSRRLWVDAVCINQSDADERSQQVARMASIYKGATRTVVWLGEGESAKQNLNILATVQCHEQAPSSSHVPGTHVWHSINGDKFDICSLQLHEQGFYRDISREMAPPVVDNCTDLVIGFAQFFTQRYFLRRWIFQELYHSPRFTTLAYWGACNGTMENLSKINYPLCRLQLAGVIWQAMNFHDSLLSSTWLRVQDFLDPIFSMHWAPVPSWDLLEVFITCTHMECSDPRDRIYSILSVSDTLGITPDYSLSTKAVCSQFARALLSHGYLAVVLINSPRKRYNYSGSTAITAASWIPDLRSPLLKGSRQRDPTFQDLIVEISEENVLTLSPFVCGVVKSVERVDNGVSLKIGFLTSCKHEVAIDMASHTMTNPSMDAPAWIRAPKYLEDTNSCTTQDISIIVSRWNSRCFVRSGDLCCSLTSNVSESRNCIFMLRTTQSEIEEFELVDTFDTLMDIEKTHPEEQLPTLPPAIARTTVKIV